MQLSLANVINISVSATPAGVGAFNTSNIALFTRETPGGDFGSAGYKIYLDPTQVTTDFGSDSFTSQMALTAFAQQPNLLAGSGYLVVIPFLTTGNTAVQHLAFSGTAASGSFKLNYAGGVTSAIQWNDTAGTIQTAIRTLPGLSLATVSGSIAAGLDVTFTGVGGAPALLTVSDDSLQTGGSVAITITVTTTTPGTHEAIVDAVTRTKDLVQYFGILVAELTPEAAMDAAAAIVQVLLKVAFWVSRSSADIEPGGALDDLATESLTRSRGLYYGGATDISALIMAASYAGRALSTNFSGSNTTQTMHLKDLIGVDADPTMTQTLLNKAVAAGADTYVSLQGVPKVFTSGENDFFDQVYNLLWFVGALEVAGFNALAQSSTKLPQTEQGVSVLKGAYRQVCEQSVSNQYSAPGAWTSPTTFGNQADFLRNIQERGYYIFSSPVATQPQVDRDARKAPLIQLALKEAGALHSSNVIIYVNS